MNYKQIVYSMPSALREQLEGQNWAAPFQRKGMELWDILSSKAALLILLNQMSRVEQKTLRIIVTRIGDEAFDEKRLEKDAESMLSGAECKVGLTGLRRYGVVCTLRKSWGEHLHVLPWDGFCVWQSVLLTSFQKEQSEQIFFEESVHLLRTARGGLANELFHVLLYASRNELLLTSKGMLHKRHIEKLTEMIHLQDEDVSGMGLQYAHSDGYGPALAIVLDMALRLGLFVQENGRMSIQTERLRNWMHLSMKSRNEQMYQHLLQLQLPAAVWLQHAMSMMQTVPNGQWYILQSLFTWMRHNDIPLGVKPSDDCEMLQRLQQNWIEPLAAFGYIELGESVEGVKVFRWLTDVKLLTETEENTAFLKGHEAFYVQPDFELILPPQVPFYIKWEVGAFAEHVKTDQVAYFRMTKESVLNALEGGRTAEEIQNFLRQHSLYGVPDHVLLTLEQWGEQFGKLHFAQVTLLRCQSSGLAAEVERNPKCRPFLLSKVGDRDFIVEGKQFQPLLRLLEQSGYAPRKTLDLEGVTSANVYPSFLEPNGVNSPDVRLDPGDDFAVKGLIYSKDSARYFEVEPKLPSMEDIYPFIQEIPSLWLKDIRVYHTSTCKEMIQKAIEWKSYLKLKKGGVERFVAPRALQESRNVWSVIGMEEANEIRILPEEWEEMQLILPGINDQ